MTDQQVISRWYHWLVLVVLMLCVAAWAAMFSVWHSQYPARQRLPAEVEPLSFGRGGTITVKMTLTRDNMCRVNKMWWVVDPSGTTIVSDRAELPPGSREVIPLVKEYRIPVETEPGEAVLNRRLEWRCNWVQEFTRPGVDLEPVFLTIEDNRLTRRHAY